MSGRARAAVDLSSAVLAAVLVVVAGWPWLRGFPVGALAVHLVVAAVVGVAVPAVAARVLRLGFFVSVGASAALALVYLPVAVVREPLGIGALGRGFSTGAAQLLSNTLPLGGDPALLVLPVVVVWATAAAVGESVARGRAAAEPAAVAALSFGGAYAVTAGGVGDEVVASTALLAVGALLVVLRRFALEADAVTVSDEEASRRRPLVLGAAAVAVVAAVSGLAVPRLAALQEPPARPDRRAPEEQPEHIAPLADVSERRRAGANGDDAVLLSVDLDAPSPGYLTLAQLDRYDGDTWRLDSIFVPTGGRIPDPPSAAAATGDGAGTTVRQRAEVVADLPGGGTWMPLVARPVDIQGVAVRYVPATAMVMPVQALAVGSRYEVTSVAPSPDLVSLVRSGGTAKIDRSARSATELPAELQPDLQAWLDDLAKPANARPEPTVEFLATLARELRTSYFRTEESRDRLAAAAAASAGTVPPSTAPDGAAVDGTTPGTTPGTEPLPERPNAGGTGFAEVTSAIGLTRAATPEQFATLYALLARKLGVPARVVTGFRLGGVEGGVPAGHHDVRASQAWTWVEIATRDRGWLVVDPTPERTSLEARRDTKSIVADASSSTTATTQLAAAGTILRPVNTEATRTVGRVEGESSPPWWIAVVVLFAVAALSAVPVYRLVRRNRRRQGEPTAQAIGAWHETLDVLDAARVGPLASLTATQVVGIVAERFGTDAARGVGVVAGVANQALFLPAGVRADDAERAWQEVEAFRPAVAQSLGLGGRLLAGLRVGRGARIRTP